MKKQETKAVSAARPLCGLVRIESNTTMELLIEEHAFCPIVEFPGFVVIAVDYYEPDERALRWSFSVYTREPDGLDCDAPLVLRNADSRRYAFSGEAISAAIATL